MIYRKDDWYQALMTYLSSISRKQFDPARFNCGIFTAGAVEAMTGHNLVPDVGSYRTISGGIRKLRKIGFEDHVSVVRNYFPEISPAFLKAGDIAVVRGMDDNALGIVQGSAIYVLPPEGHLGLVPFMDAILGFEIPYRVKE